MTTTLTAMLHVPDVEPTAAWYARLGFTIDGTASDGDETIWARLTLGDQAIMLNCGGRPPEHDRRDVDLYIGVDDIDARRAELPEEIEVIRDLYLAYHGTREFIIRDPNGFWITFGQWVGEPEASD
ncbi:hypothetical protein GCM10009422_10700 [Brevundimonas kwangchunensis]|uniref:VOC domain-containing protein n=1 Tax=Brevundimonas kwangchunensis TaxID=322163 RepID=A0ABN1GRH1_9CAUL